VYGTRTSTASHPCGRNKIYRIYFIHLWNVNKINKIKLNSVRLGYSKFGQIKLAGHVARMGEERKVYKVLVGKPEGKSPLGRPRRRWEDGIRMDLREIGLGGVDWIRLTQDRDGWRAVVSAVMNLRVLAHRS
jgi:hypothetical protein